MILPHISKDIIYNAKQKLYEDILNYRLNIDKYSEFFKELEIKRIDYFCVCREGIY